MTIPALLAGALLASSSLYPDQLREVLTKFFPVALRLADANSSSTNNGNDSPYSANFGLLLKAVLALDALRTINRVLNRMATNNWRYSADPSWGKNWPDEVAVVTGGCSGIGQKLVYGLLEKGATVVVLDIQDMPDEMWTTAEAISSTSCSASGSTASSSSPSSSGAGPKKDKQKLFFYKCDVTNPDSVSAAASSISQNPSTSSGPTILINNAGVSHELPILTVPLPQVQRIFQVNTISHWTLAQAFVPGMLARGRGHVVTVASLASFVALPYGGAYAATKASALAFHEALQCELKHIHKRRGGDKHQGVICTIVHPNFVDTPLTQGFAEKLRGGGLPPMLSSQEVSDAVLEQVVGKRRGGQVFVPRKLWVLKMLRAAPNWMQEVLRDALGRRTAKQFGRVDLGDLPGQRARK